MFSSNFERLGGRARQGIGLAVAAPRHPAQLHCAQDLQGLSVEQAQAVVEHIRRQAREIALKQAKLDKLNFELARLKAWKFSAKTEAMNAQQRQMFEDTLAGLQSAAAAGMDSIVVTATHHQPLATNVTGVPDYDALRALRTPEGLLRLQRTPA